MLRRKRLSRAHGPERCDGRREHSAPASAAGEDQPHEAAEAIEDTREKSSGGERLVEILLAVLIMGVYIATLYPSVAGGDSGELVAESCHLGVSHPPGYPLFNMLVYLITTYMPTEKSKAWKANAFSAACDTIAAVVMYRTILLWTSRSAYTEHRKTSAFVASALFAFSPLIWTYAVGAEVFALNNLFAASLIYTLLQYSIERSMRLAKRGALLCGLAMCNQHTIVLFEIPIIIWVIWSRRSTILWGELRMLATSFFVGLMPYAYMPITATWNAQPGSWGDVTSVSGFFRHLRRADYGTFRLFSTNQKTEDLLTRLRLYFIDLSGREVPFHLALPLVLAGILASVSLKYVQQHSLAQSSQGNGFGRLMVFVFAFYMVVFHALANLPLNEGLLYGVHMRFWQQPNIVVFMWIGLGLNTILHQTTRLSKRKLSSVLTRFVILALPAYQLMRWYSFCDQSEALYIRDYASALLDPLPPSAILFVNFDLQWTSLRYLQRCENRRTDVTIINFSMMTYKWFASKHAHYPRLRFPGTRLVSYGSTNGFTFAEFLSANQHLISTTGVFFGGKLNYDDADFRSSFTFVPFGLLDMIRPLSSSPQPLHLWYSHQTRVRQMVGMRLPKLPPPHKYDDETWEWTIARDHAMKQLSWSTYLLERTIEEDPQNLTLLVEATHAMEHSFQYEPSQFWSASANLKNLGLAYAQIIKSKEEFTGGQDPFFNSAVGSAIEDPTKYKDRASSRMLEVWNKWLDVPDAQQDPGYKAIEGVVRRFLPQTVNPNSFKAQATSRAKTTKKTKKLKTKTKKRVHGSVQSRLGS